MSNKQLPFQRDFLYAFDTKTETISIEPIHQVQLLKSHHISSFLASNFYLQEVHKKEHVAAAVYLRLL